MSLSTRVLGPMPGLTSADFPPPLTDPPGPRKDQITSQPQTCPHLVPRPNFQSLQTRPRWDVTTNSSQRQAYQPPGNHRRRPHRTGARRRNQVRHRSGTTHSLRFLKKDEHVTRHSEWGFIPTPRVVRMLLQGISSNDASGSLVLP